MKLYAFKVSQIVPPIMPNLLYELIVLEERFRAGEAEQLLQPLRGRLPRHRSGGRPAAALPLPARARASDDLPSVSFDAKTTDLLCPLH